LKAAVRKESEEIFQGGIIGKESIFKDTRAGETKISVVGRIPRSGKGTSNPEEAGVSGKKIVEPRQRGRLPGKGGHGELGTQSCLCETFKDYQLRCEGSPWEPKGSRELSKIDRQSELKGVKGGDP